MLTYDEELPVLERANAVIFAVDPPRDRDGDVQNMLHSTMQQVYKFESNAAAMEAFEEDRATWERLTRTSTVKSVDFQVSSENHYAECTPWYDGNRHTCRAILLQDQYVVLSDAMVSNELITMEEWAALLQVIDAKIMDQAGSDSAVEPAD